MRASLERCYNNIPETPAEHRFSFLPWTQLATFHIQRWAGKTLSPYKKPTCNFLLQLRTDVKTKQITPWMNKQTNCQSDQTILVQIKEDYWKIHGLIWWQKSLLSSWINTQWLAGYFECITSPNFFFSHDCKCWTTFFCSPSTGCLDCFWYDS